MANNTNDNYVQASIPRFDGNHYDHWSMLMENFLRSKEYWYLIEEGIETPTQGETLTEAQKKKIEDSRIKDFKAKNYLFQAIDRATLETIQAKDTAKDIWDSLKKRCQGNTRVKRAVLNASRKEFEAVEMKSNENITEYVTRVMSIANKMRFHGEKLEDYVIVEKVLRSLTEKFLPVVCSIEESRDTDKMQVDELLSSLVVHEQKIQRFQKPNSEEQALKVSTQEKGDSWSKNRGRGGSNARGRGRGRGRQSIETVECYKCRKLGHYRSDCPEWEKEANYAEQDDQEPLLLMMMADTPQYNKEEVWFLDSGCSNHMTGIKSWFVELDETFKLTVRLGNNTRMTVAGKGKINLVVNGVSHIVSDVFFVPELKNNLLSLGQFHERGLTILFQSNCCKIYHPERGLLFESKMSSNRMFKIMAPPTSKEVTNIGDCMYSAQEDVSHLWHCRYAHLSLKGLNL